MSRKKNRGMKTQRIVSEYTGMKPDRKKWWLAHMQKRRARLENALADASRQINRAQTEELKAQWTAVYEQLWSWLDRCEAEVADLYCELEEAAP